MNNQSLPEYQSAIELSWKSGKFTSMIGWVRLEPIGASFSIGYEFNSTHVSKKILDKQKRHFKSKCRL